MLRGELTETTLATGLLPVSLDLREARLVAERRAGRVGDAPVLEGFDGTVYTDGSAVYPADPWLRRAGWGVAYCWQGRWCSVSGPPKDGRR